MEPNYQQTGIEVATQYPLDAKTFFKSLAAMRDLGQDSNYPFKYYNGMLCFCAETNRLYVWREAAENTVGVLENHFLYPSDTVVDNVDYSGKEFNFFPFNRGDVNAYEVHFMVTQVDDANPEIDIISSGDFPNPEQLLAERVQEGKYGLLHPLLIFTNLGKINLQTNNYTIVGTKEFFVHVNLDNKFYIETVAKAGSQNFEDSVLIKHRFILYIFLD